MDAVIQECDCWPLSIGIGKSSIKYGAVHATILLSDYSKNLQDGLRNCSFQQNSLCVARIVAHFTPSLTWFVFSFESSDLQFHFY